MEELLRDSVPSEEDGAITIVFDVKVLMKRDTLNAAAASVAAAAAAASAAPLSSPPSAADSKHSPTMVAKHKEAKRSRMARKKHHIPGNPSTVPL